MPIVLSAPRPHRLAALFGAALATLSGATCTNDEPDVPEGSACEPSEHVAYCEGDVIWHCDTESRRLTSYACSAESEQCLLDGVGYAFCGLPCPEDLDPRGECDGTRVRSCFGEILVDSDCADDGQACARDSEGVASCTDPCPLGIDAFGVCEGNVARRCDGEVFVEDDCNETSTRCEVVSRHGVGCRGCVDRPPESACVGQGVLEGCSATGEMYERSCTVLGGTCTFDSERCEHDCTGEDPVPCITEGLAEGESRCRTSSATGFSVIARCVAGELLVDECPGASDGSVGCEEIDGTPHCTMTGCGPAGRRCTDRGVLATCGSGPVLAWLDCSIFGTCVDDGQDAYCACAGPLPDYASQCADGERRACVDGRLEISACSCEGPEPDDAIGE